MIALDRGESPPQTAEDFSGLCCMGGPMSVNDDLPWIDPVCALIRDAAARDIPVIGHCLGGQLIAKAFGGEVRGNPCSEIGWSRMTGNTDETSRRWLGAFAGTTMDIFQWHGETFSLPEEAVLLASSEACPRQMFAIGPHLAMQGHVEMLPEMIAAWCAHWEEDTAHLAPQPTVQTPRAIHAGTAEKLPALRRLADQLYGVWIEGLRR
ncbi:MAG: type 1 glutamine amidotransferase [Zoogloeaceae bacterium]|nr:type 1 glutamine amidotransferase [Zoogloeaceae bacterium]